MIRPVVISLKELRRPCELVKEDEDVSQIVTDLRDTLKTLRGYGLAANQIGCNKAVSVVNFNGVETVLINPRILEKEGKYEFRGEACLSFPGLGVNTDRYYQVVVQNGVGDKVKRGSCEGMEAAVWQHEVDHLEGRTIFDRKHKAK